MERSRINKRKKTWQQQLSSRPEGPLLAKGLAGHGSFISSLCKKSSTAWDIGGKNGSVKALSPVLQTPAQGHK